MHLSIADGIMEEHPRKLPARAPGFRGCILSLPQPYFSQEQGIKARICPQGSVLEWQREWAHLHSAGTENNKIHTVTARAFQREWSAPILFFFDGNDGEDFLSFHQKAQFSAI
ncbi:MAG: hypothetical protein KDK37_05300, partial [Leptospiraceae bacterium]|nr:hypothetical protein [Leptospiraceae bacterium]